MKAKSRRQERVGSLIQEALSRPLIEEVQHVSTSLVTITRVDVTSDLLTARAFLSIYGPDDPRAILAHLEKRAGHFRKALASMVKLKYNPMLFFSLDPTLEVEQRIDELLQSVKKTKRDSS